MKSMFNAKQRWSLRKLSIGVCSVLLGMTILGARQTALANTAAQKTPATPTNSQGTTDSVSASAALDAAKKNTASAQANLDSAQTALTNAQSSAQSQNTKVSAAQSAYDTASQAHDDAQKAVLSAKALAGSANSENLTSTQNQIKNQKVKIANDSVDVTRASQAVDSSTKGVKSASDTVSSAQVAVNNQNKAVSAAQSSLENAQNILSGSDTSSASRALSDAKAKVQSDQSAVTNASVALSGKQSALSAASDAVNSAQEVANNASTNVTTAKSAVQSAQSAVNNANSAASAAQSNVAQASHEVSEKQIAYNSASAAIVGSEADLTQSASEASEMVASDNQAINSQKAQVASASTVLSEAKSAQIVAQSSADAASAAFSSASENVMQQQVAYDNLTNATAVPTFTFTDAQKTATQEFIKAVKNYIDANNHYFNSSDIGTNAITKTAYENWQTAMQMVKNPNDYYETQAAIKQITGNWVDTHTSDKNEKLDLMHLSREQVTELSQFAAAVINEIRNSLGVSGIVGKEVVTQGLVGLAQEVGEQYSTRTDETSGHYIYALKKANYDYGLYPTAPTDADKQAGGINDQGESLATKMSPNYTSTETMADAKAEIVDSIVSMLINDAGSSMGHAESMVGMYTLVNSANNQEYLGASISYQHISDWPAHLIHFMQFNPWDIETRVQRATSSQQTEMLKKQQANGLKSIIANDSYESSSSSQEAIKRAKDSLDSAKNDLTIKQAANTDAQRMLVTAKKTWKSRKAIMIMLMMILADFRIS